MRSVNVLKRRGRSAPLNANVCAAVCYWCALAALAGLIVLGSAPTQPLLAGISSQNAAARLTLDEVLGLVRSGESEELIVARIKRNGRPFDLSAEERNELKREGISDTIMKYLVEPSLPYSAPAPPPPPPPKVPSKDYPKDDFALKIPPDVGLYLMDKSPPVRIDLKTLVASKQGGLSSKLSGGVSRKKVIGRLVGAIARSRSSATPATFYLRIAEPNKIEELVLVLMERGQKTRELEFAADKEGKASLKVESLQQFDPQEVGARLYKITVPKLQKGEYLFYLIGSADPGKGIQGKGYDFGVD